MRGLAWTSVGGDTLQIEVNMMPGKGELELTGQLGDVMKESAMTGLSYIRSVSERYQIDPDVFKRMIFIFIFRRERFQRTDPPPVLRWRRRFCLR